MNKKLIFLIFGMIFLMSFVSATLWNSTSVVSYFSFNDTSASTLKDSTGRVNSQVYNSPTLGVAGKNSTAYNFTTGTQYVYMNKSLFDFKGMDNFTMSVWVYMPKYTGTDFIFAHENTPTRQYSFGIDATKLYLETNAGVNFASGGTAIPLAQWNMLTYVVNGTNLVVYLNGVQDGIGARASITDGTDTNGTIGKREFDGNFYQGLLDEMVILNRSWNGTEVSQAWNGGSGLFYRQEPSTPASILVTLNSPSNDSTQLINSIQFNANILPSGSINSTNETLRIWYSNGTLFKTSVNLTYGFSNFNVTWNETNFVYGQDYIWTVFAYGNDSNIYYAANNYTFTASVFSEDVTTYNSSVLETTNQSYKLQITSLPNVNSVSGRLWYNGSSYGSSVQDGTASGKYNLTNFIMTPLQSTSGSKSFFWQIDFTLTSGSTVQQNSSALTQQVNRTILTFCNATYATNFVNFSTYSATNPFPSVNATFKSAFTWFALGGDGTIYRNYTYEDVTETNSTWSFCGNYNTTFYTSANIEYDGTDYALNHYYLADAPLTNTTSSIPLYLLNNSAATATVLKVIDAIQNPIEDVLISIQFYDVGTDTFYTVGMGKTSFTGETLAYLNWYDSLYRFVLTKNGEVIKSTTTTGIFETPQIFKISEGTDFNFTKFRDFVYNLYFNDATSQFVLTFTKPSGLVDEGCLRVSKRTAQNDTIICHTCESSSSATLYCDVSSYGNGTYVATFYATGSWDLINFLSKTIGGGLATGIFNALSSADRLFYSFIFGGIVIFMFIVTPVLGIVGVILAMLGSAALGFQLIDYTILIGISIVGGIIIWFLKK